MVHCVAVSCSVVHCVAVIILYNTSSVVHSVAVILLRFNSISWVLHSAVKILNTHIEYDIVRAICWIQTCCITQCIQDIEQIFNTDIQHTVHSRYSYWTKIFNTQCIQYYTSWMHVHSRYSTNWISSTKIFNITHSLNILNALCVGYLCWIFNTYWMLCHPMRCM